jgi:hypothetical protein
MEHEDGAFKVNATAGARIVENAACDAASSMLQN